MCLKKYAFDLAYVRKKYVRQVRTPNFANMRILYIICSYEPGMSDFYDTLGIQWRRFSQNLSVRKSSPDFYASRLNQAEQKYSVIEVRTPGFVLTIQAILKFIYYRIDSA